MKLYFSGIRSDKEVELLQAAGVTRVLVDQFDLPNVEGWDGIDVILDSGAYKLFRTRQHGNDRLLDILAPHLEPDAYAQLAASREFVSVVSLDVIGDPQTSFDNWERLKGRIPNLMPVWHWGASNLDHLAQYLAEADVVGIGGLVPLMRAKDEAMLAELTKMCECYPKRFHVFGINWLKAIESLKDLLASGDTSKFLDGGRYGHVVFKHTRNGHLQQAPAKVLPFAKDWDRVQRCVQSAIEMAAFCEEA
jgi:hypothetical protein